jgi:hypothetical protein
MPNELQKLKRRFALTFELLRRATATLSALVFAEMRKFG